MATILLDRKFRLKRFTPATTRLLRVIDTHVGRPISDLAKTVIDDSLLSDAAKVLESLVPLTKDVQDADGRRYLRRIVPYRTDDNRIDGVVITFTDVTDRKERERVLENYNEQLEKDVAERTAQLEIQAREMAEITEQERQRLGRELHDSLSQNLTAIGVMVATLKESAGKASEHGQLIEKLETATEEAKRQVRSLTKGLFPVDVDAQGLRIALRELARETESLFRVPVRFNYDERVQIEDNFTATQLFLVAREAVQNAARHAKPTLIAIRLEDDDGIRMTVEDNGQGMGDKNEGTSGMGLRIMQHRSSLIDGKLKIESLDGRGTRVVLHVPHPTGGAKRTDKPS